MWLLKAIWYSIFLGLSLFVLIGVLWLLRVMIDWYLDIDYIEKIKKWMRHE